MKKIFAALLMITLCSCSSPEPGKSTAPSEQETKAIVSTTVEESTPSSRDECLEAAKKCIEVMPYSEKQLAEKMEQAGYSHEDAVYSAENCGADWNEQAAKAAKECLKIVPSFSEEQLLHELTFCGFTEEQAAYGISKVDIKE